jgi:hypothetical protein
MRTLATIQIIKDINPIQNADAIERATVSGWHLVVKKGEFKVGDMCVYFEIDSILPEKPEYEFLRPRNFKVKTIKLRGQVSQGICFPIDAIPELKGKYWKEGEDVTELLGVTKYEPPPPNFLSNKPATRLIFPKWMPSFVIQFLRKYFHSFCERHFRKSINAKTFPPFLVKTDETRVQVLQSLLDKYASHKCFITEKLDGSSVTYYIKGNVFGVCSRNLELPMDENNGFWKAAIQNEIENKLKSAKRNIAIQGELIGEGIQGNKYGLKGLDVRFFQAFDINKQTYLCYSEFIEFIQAIGLKTVPVICEDFTLINDIDHLVNKAVGKSLLNNTVHREGIVIRPVEEICDFDFSNIVRGRISFKAINPDFLIKYGE